MYNTNLEANNFRMLFKEYNSYRVSFKWNTKLMSQTLIYAFNCMSLTEPGISMLVSFTMTMTDEMAINTQARMLCIEMHKKDTQRSISDGPHMWGFWPGSSSFFYIYVIIHSWKQNAAIEMTSLQNVISKTWSCITMLNLHTVIAIITW